MVVRNPVRNISQPEPLQLACFVAMMMVLQKRRIEAEHRYISDDTQEASWIWDPG
jgi:Txe/YoeB family toxin of Txe-Axe toxin-antitoxin module